MTVDELSAGIENESPAVRTAAWRAAPQLGAAALVPLAGLTRHENFEVRRAATRGMWAVVRDVGRPGEESARGAVCAELVTVLEGTDADTLRRDVLWMLSEIAGDGEVAAIAALLEDSAVRDDARMALENIPGDASLSALRAALESADDAFKPAIAQSLRARGVETPGHPSVKLVPAYPDEVEVEV